MLYHLYDLHHAALSPLRHWAEVTRHLFQNPFLPYTYTQVGRVTAAWADLSHRAMMRYDRPEFGIEEVKIAGKTYTVEEDDVIDKPFCRLKHFKVKGLPQKTAQKRETVLICAPLAGHHATLLRGTVSAMLNEHDVYITDWKNARHVPMAEGHFDLDDCIKYLIEFMRHLQADKGHINVVAVCQPAVPATCATSLLAKWQDDAQPRTLTLMGGPIDTRVASTEVNRLAETRPLSWFQQHVITKVPPWYAGAMRDVYPGFLQLTGFMSMNLDRHVDAHVQYFDHLVQGDGESVDAHRAFYDEYLAVMDLTADFYLQTVERVFQKHLLPKGEFIWHGETVDCADIQNTALLAVEGERDDISAPGQTEAAIDLFSNLPKDKKKHYLQKEAGHYGIFNGRKWREQVRPVITKFIRDHAK